MTLTYLLGDQLGSTSLAVDAATGDVVETRYKAWGEVRFTTAGMTLPTRNTFTGQYSYVADDATDLGNSGFGLLFYNSRFYDPALGRFTQADTIVPGGVQGMDRYAYVNNSPLNYVDPSGHFGQCNDNMSGYQCGIRQNKVRQLEDSWGTTPAPTTIPTTVDDCHNLTCDSGVSSGSGSGPIIGGGIGAANRLDFTGYSSWEIQILQELYNRGGTDAIYGVNYILSNDIHIAVGGTSDWQTLGNIEGWYDSKKNTVFLNPKKGYNDEDLPRPWGLATIIHEAKHIEQGRLSRYGELEAWQIGFRVAERLGHYPNGIDPLSVTQAILDLPLSNDIATLKKFSSYVHEYDSKYFFFFSMLPYR